MLGIQSSILPVAFGKVLRRERKRVGLTQEQLAFESELQRNYISMLELGQYQPTITTLFSLAHGLKMSPRDLIGLLEVEAKAAD